MKSEQYLVSGIVTIKMHEYQLRKPTVLKHVLQFSPS